MVNQINTLEFKSEAAKRASWFDIARIGVVQACMGAVVVTTTTTLNRVMVVELALPAVVPGLLVSLHYFVQMIRPKLGHGADQTHRFTPWILGGMLVLALGGVLAALATLCMGHHFVMGFLIALLGFCMIGMGVSACGTPLLVLLSKGVGDHQRAPSATAVWIMMIFGFALTSVLSGKLLDPFTFEKLLMVSVGVSVLSVTLSALSLMGLENRLLKTRLGSKSPVEFDALSPSETESKAQVKASDFRTSLWLLWRDDQARYFTYFVFTSMLAYSAQDLILEPFAGLIYHFSPGQTTQLSGTLHSSVLIGMLLLALIGSAWVKGRLGKISSWMVVGCILSALGMSGLGWAALVATHQMLLPLTPFVLILGLGNGLFSIAAVSTMMRLSTETQDVSRMHAQGIKPGLKMGLWGAAQAVAFGLGGVVGTAVSDLSLRWMDSVSSAYSMVFALEALVFLSASVIAWRFKKLNVGTLDQPNSTTVAQGTTPLTLKAI